MALAHQRARASPLFFHFLLSTNQKTDLISIAEIQKMRKKADTFFSVL